MSSISSVLINAYDILREIIGIYDIFYCIICQWIEVDVSFLFFFFFNFINSLFMFVCMTLYITEYHAAHSVEAASNEREML